MTEPNSWQPPVDPTQQGSSTPFGPPQGTPDAGAQQGWAPPPKPGLIPLRPIDFGTLLGASFNVLRRNPRPTYGAALLIYGGITILTILVVGAVSVASISRIVSASDADADIVAAGALGLIGLAGFATTLVSIIGIAVLQGVLIIEVARGTLGEKLTMRQLFRGVKGRFGALIGWALLLSLAGALTIGLFVGLLIGMAFLGPVGVVMAIVVGILGTLGLIVLFVWITTKVSLTPSAIVLERLSIRDAVARSWNLTRGHFWKVFGIQLLVAFIVSTAIQIISAPLSFASVLVTGLIDPTGAATQTTMVVSIILLILSYIVTIAVGALGSVVQSATPALLYLDLRIRKEGLDLELIRYVEDRQAGRTDVPDPYEPRHTQTRPPAPGASPSAPASDSPWL